MFYLTTHSTHFIYGYMASDIWLRTILIVRKETRCRHMGYSHRLAARVLLYASSHIHIPLPLLHQSWSTGWNEKYLNRSTIKDRPDDPSYHERTLLPRSYISLGQRGMLHVRRLASRAGFQSSPQTQPATSGRNPSVGLPFLITDDLLVLLRTLV